MPLERVAEDVWVHAQGLRTMGLRLQTRMTVIRLGDGRLFLHSPVGLSHELREELDRLGEVALVVAPNRYHHRYVGDYAVYPHATFLAAPGLPEKRPDLRFDGILEARPPPGWPEALAYRPIDGAPALSETIFFHRPSRSLLLTDLAFNIRSASFPARAYFTLSGVYGRPAQSRLMFLLVRDRRRFADSLRAVLEWDFVRVIPCHGDLMAGDAKTALTRAWARPLRY